MEAARRIAVCYCIAPLLFIVTKNIYDRTMSGSGHSELSWNIAYYVFSMMHLLAPLALTLVIVSNLPKTYLRYLVATSIFVILFPVLQIASQISIVDALSLSRSLPDDPSSFQRIQASILGWSIEAIFAYCIAGVVGGGLLIAGWRD